MLLVSRESQTDPWLRLQNRSLAEIAWSFESAQGVKSFVSESSRNFAPRDASNDEFSGCQASTQFQLFEPNP